MNDYDFLSRDEPGRPLVQLPPGFVDKLMERIGQMERRRKLRRIMVILAAGACVIALVAWVVGHYS